jgi:hypothetical protein
MTARKPRRAATSATRSAPFIELYVMSPSNAGRRALRSASMLASLAWVGTPL